MKKTFILNDSPVLKKYYFPTSLDYADAENSDATSAVYIIVKVIIRLLIN